MVSFLCVCPPVICRVFGAFKNTNNRETVYAWFTFSHWLIYANSAANPIIYNFLSGEYLQRDFGIWHLSLLVLETHRTAYFEFLPSLYTRFKSLSCLQRAAWIDLFVSYKIYIDDQNQCTACCFLHLLVTLRHCTFHSLHCLQTHTRLQSFEMPFALRKHPAPFHFKRAN